jgi:hypothetical protein
MEAKATIRPGLDDDAQELVQRPQVLEATDEDLRVKAGKFVHVRENIHCTNLGLEDEQASIRLGLDRPQIKQSLARSLLRTHS